MADGVHCWNGATRLCIAAARAGLVAAVALAVPFASSASAQTVEATIEVIAPERKPDGNLWDSAVGGLLAGRTHGILPDIVICVSSARMPKTCAPPCLDNRTCRATLRIVPDEPLTVDVTDLDIEQHDPMYAMKIDTPAKCTPCRIGDGSGKFPVRIALSESGCVGPLCGRVTSRPASATPGDAPRFRDLANCTGKDVFLPSGTVIVRGQPVSDAFDDRLYEIAKWVAAIEDEQGQREVMLRLQRRMHSVDFDKLEGTVLPDVRNSNNFHNAMVALLKNIVTATKPSLPAGMSAAEWTAYYKRGVVKKMKGGLTDRIIDALIPSTTKVTAECALNEIMREVYDEAKVTTR
jgi:hypothetical protein